MTVVEVITSVERRRRWSRDEKLRIVAESGCSRPRPRRRPLALLLERRGQRIWRCPHSAEGGMRAPNEGSGFDPKQHYLSARSKAWQ
jgi:hypothetical protein